MKTEITMFNRAGILQQIGHRRIAKFLDCFLGDLASVNLVTPPVEPTTDDYFSKTAEFLSNSQVLPARLLGAMRALETAAAAENDARLDALIQQHIPNVSISRSCPLDCALELWFTAPELLSKAGFTAPESSSLAAPKPPSIGGSSTSGPDRGTSSARSSHYDASGPIVPRSQRTAEQIRNSADQSAIENRKSKIENGNASHTDPAPDGQANDTNTFSALAQLSPADYDRARKEAARSLRVRVETLDAEVTRVRNQIRDDEAFNSALSTLHSPLPWPEPVDGAELLTQIVDRFRHYLILPPGAAEGSTLWSAHAHCFSAFTQSPRLNLSSPEPGCGKTTALDVIAALTPRALRTENLTAPVLFRLVHQYQPTLLLDEVDSWLPQAEELRGLLNAGHKRGACAYRCDGEGNAVRPFRAFSPAVLAGIGALPGTLHDRSVVVRLVKAEAHEVRARFNDQRAELEHELCRKLARWTADNFEVLKSCDPSLPATAFNRLADNWHPLFAIAQIAGGPWPDLALSSFNQLTNPPLRLPPPPRSCASSSLAAPNSNEGGSSTFPAPSEALPAKHSQLLEAIRQIFAQTGVTRISSKQLVDYLSADPSIQPSTNPLIGLTQSRLSRQLAKFGVHSRPLRLTGRLVRGYDLADFTTAFTRFLKNGR